MRTVFRRVVAVIVLLLFLIPTFTPIASAVTYTYSAPLSTNISTQSPNTIKQSVNNPIGPGVTLPTPLKVIKDMTSSVSPLIEALAPSFQTKNTYTDTISLGVGTEYPTRVTYTETSALSIGLSTYKGGEFAYRISDTVVRPRGSAVFEVEVLGANVNVSIGPTPQGITISPSQATVADGTTYVFTISATQSATPGSYLVPVSLSNGTTTYTDFLRVIVLSSDWLPGWLDRKPVVVNSVSTTAVADYTVKLRLTRDPTLQSTPNTIYCGDCSPHFTDVRVTGPDGVTLLPYAIIPYTQDEALLFVNIPNLPAYPSQYVFYIYYNNPSARYQEFQTSSVYTVFDDIELNARGTLYGTAFKDDYKISLLSVGGYAGYYSYPIIQNAKCVGVVFDLYIERIIGRGEFLIGFWASGYQTSGNGRPSSGFLILDDSDRFIVQRVANGRVTNTVIVSGNPVEAGVEYKVASYACVNGNSVELYLYVNGSPVVEGVSLPVLPNMASNPGDLYIAGYYNGVYSMVYVDNILVSMVTANNPDGLASTNTGLSDAYPDIVLDWSKVRIIPGMKVTLTLTATGDPSDILTLQITAPPEVAVSSSNSTGVGSLVTQLDIQALQNVKPGVYTVELAVSSTQGATVKATIKVEVAPPWMNGWLKRVPITVYNPEGVTGTAYLRITVLYGSGVNSENMVYCGYTCRPDFEDLRFTASDGVSLLEYWVENAVPYDYAEVWVKVPLSGAPTEEVYLYYGNATAKSAETDPTHFFLYYDAITSTQNWSNIGAGGFAIKYGDEAGYNDVTALIKESGNSSTGVALQTGAQIPRGVVLDVFYSRTTTPRTFLDSVGLMTVSGEYYSFAIQDSNTRSLQLYAVLEASTANGVTKVSQSVGNAYNLVYNGWGRGQLVLLQNEVQFVMYTTSGVKALKITLSDSNLSGFSYVFFKSDYGFVADSIKIYTYTGAVPSVGGAEGFEISLPRAVVVGVGETQQVDITPRFKMDGRSYVVNVSVTSPPTIQVSLSGNTIAITPTQGATPGYSSIQVVLELDTLAQATSILRTVVVGNGWLPGWIYRSIVLLEFVESVTGYIHEVELVRGNGVSTDTTLYLSTKVRPDFADVRFTSADGLTELGYWYYQYRQDSAVFWVSVGDVPEYPALVPLIIYYGSNIQTTTANPNSVFLFFDDFQNLSQWNTNAGSEASIVNGTLVRMDGDWDFGKLYLNTQQSFTVPVEVIAVGALGTVSGVVNLFIGITTSPTGYYTSPGSIYGVYDAYTSKAIYAGVWYSCGQADDIDMHLFKLSYSGYTVRFYDDDLGECAFDYRMDGQVYVSIGADPNVHYRVGYLDLVAVKPYFPVEPVLALSVEEAYSAVPRTLPILVSNPTTTLYFAEEYVPAVKITLDSTNFADWNYLIDYSIYFTDWWGNPLYYYIETLDPDTATATIYVLLPHLLPRGVAQIYLNYGSTNPYYDYRIENPAFVGNNGQWYPETNFNGWGTTTVQELTGISDVRVTGDSITIYGSSNRSVKDIPVLYKTVLASGVGLLLDYDGANTVVGLQITVSTLNGDRYTVDLLCDGGTLFFTVYYNGSNLRSSTTTCYANNPGNIDIAIASVEVLPEAVGFWQESKKDALIQVSSLITGVEIRPTVGDGGALNVKLRYYPSVLEVIQPSLSLGVEIPAPTIQQGWTYVYVARATLASPGQAPTVVRIVFNGDLLPYSVKPTGEDILATLPDGTVLTHRVVSLDPISGTAVIDVEVPPTAVSAGDVYIMIYTGSKTGVGSPGQVQASTPVLAQVMGVVLVGTIVVPDSGIIVPLGTNSVLTTVHLLKPSVYDVTISSVSMIASSMPSPYLGVLSSGGVSTSMYNGVYRIPLPSYTGDTLYLFLEAGLDGDLQSTTGYLGVPVTIVPRTPFNYDIDTLTYDTIYELFYYVHSGGESLSTAVLEVRLPDWIQTTDIAVLASIPYIPPANMVLPTYIASALHLSLEDGTPYLVSGDSGLRIDYTPYTLLSFYTSDGKLLFMVETDGTGVAVASPTDVPVMPTPSISRAQEFATRVLMAVSPIPTEERLALVPFEVVSKPDGNYLYVLLPGVETGVGSLYIVTNPSIQPPRGLEQLSIGGVIQLTRYSYTGERFNNGAIAGTYLSLYRELYMYYPSSAYYVDDVFETVGNVSSPRPPVNGELYSYRFVFAPSVAGSWTFSVSGSGVGVLRVYNLSTGDVQNVVVFNGATTNYTGTVNLTRDIYLVELVQYSSNSSTYVISAYFTPPNYASQYLLSIENLSEFGTVYGLKIVPYTSPTLVVGDKSMVETFQQAPQQAGATTIIISNPNGAPIVNSVVEIFVPPEYYNTVTETTVRIVARAPAPQNLLYAGMLSTGGDERYVLTQSGLVLDPTRKPGKGVVEIAGLPANTAVYVFDGEMFRLVAVEHGGVTTIEVSGPSVLPIAIFEVQFVDSMVPFEVRDAGWYKIVRARLPYAPPGVSSIEMYIGDYGTPYRDGLYDYVGSVDGAIPRPSSYTVAQGVTGTLLAGVNAVTQPVLAVGDVRVDVVLDSTQVLDTQVSLGVYSGAVYTSLSMSDTTLSTGAGVQRFYWLYTGRNPLMTIWGDTGMLSVLVGKDGVIFDGYTPADSNTPIARLEFSPLTTVGGIPVVHGYVGVYRGQVTITEVVIYRYSPEASGVVAPQSPPNNYASFVPVSFLYSDMVTVFNPNPYPVYDVPVYIPLADITSVASISPDGSNINFATTVLVPTGQLTTVMGVLEPGVEYSIGTDGSVQPVGTTSPSTVLLRTQPYSVVYASVGPVMRVLGADYDGDGVIVAPLSEPVPNRWVTGLYVAPATPSEMGIPYFISLDDPTMPYVIVRMQYIPANSTATITIYYGGPGIPNPQNRGVDKVFDVAVTPNNFNTTARVLTDLLGYTTVRQTDIKVTVEPNTSPSVNILLDVPWAEGYASLYSLAVSAHAYSTATSTYGSYIAVGFVEEARYIDFSGIYSTLFQGGEKTIKNVNISGSSTTVLSTAVEEEYTDSRIITAVRNHKTGYMQASSNYRSVTEAYVAEQALETPVLKLGVNDRKEDWILYWVALYTLPENPPFALYVYTGDSYITADPTMWDGAEPVEAVNYYRPLYDYQLRVPVKPGVSIPVSPPSVSELYRHVSFFASIPVSTGAVLFTTRASLNPGTVYVFDGSGYTASGTTQGDIIKLEAVGQDGLIARIYSNGKLVAEGRDYDGDGFIEIPSAVLLEGILYILSAEVRQVYLPYYMVVKSDNTVEFYVRVPYIPEGTSNPATIVYSQTPKPVEAYYGAEKTFLFYHDFASGTEGWIVLGGGNGSLSIQNSAVVGPVLELRDTSTRGRIAMLYPTVITRPFIASMLFKPGLDNSEIVIPFAWGVATPSGSSEVYWGLVYRDGLGYALYGNYYNYYTNQPMHTLMRNIYSEVWVAWDPDSGVHYSYLNGVLVGSASAVSVSGDSIEGFIYVGFSTTTAGTETLYMKRIYVRAYANPEPIGIVGGGIAPVLELPVAEAGAELTMPYSLPIDVVSEAETVSLYGAVVRVTLDNSVIPTTISTNPGSVRFIMDYYVPTGVLDVATIPLAPGSGVSVTVSGGSMQVVRSGTPGITISGISTGEAIVVAIPNGDGSLLKPRRVFMATDSNGDGVIYIDPMNYTVLNTTIQAYIMLVSVTPAKVLLPYVLTDTTGTASTYLVRVPEVNPPNTTRMYIYYGIDMGVDGRVYGVDRVLDSDLVFLTIYNYQSGTVPTNKTVMDTIFSQFTASDRQGATFVEAVSGTNPLGPDTYFASLYFAVLVTKTTPIYFYNNSDDSSDILVYNGDFATLAGTVGWYGRHTATTPPGRGGAIQVDVGGVHPALFRHVQTTGSVLMAVNVGITSSNWTTLMYDRDGVFTGWFDLYTAVYSQFLQVFVGGVDSIGGIDWYVVQWVGNQSLKPYFWFRSQTNVSIMINNSPPITFGPGDNAVELQEGQTTIHVYDPTTGQWVLLAQGLVQYLVEDAKIVVTGVDPQTRTFTAYVAIGDYPYMIRSATVNPQTPYATVTAVTESLIEITPTVSTTNVGVIVTTPLGVDASLVAPIIYYEYSGVDAVLVYGDTVFTLFNYDIAGSKLVFGGVSAIEGYIDLQALGIDPATAVVFLEANGSIIRAVPVLEVWDPTTKMIVFRG